MFLALARVFKLAVSNLRRNLWLSVATVTVMVMAIATFHLVLSLRVVTDAALGALEKKIDLAVYLAPAVSDENARALQATIAKLPGVSDVRFVSRKEALEIFKRERGKDKDIARALAEVGESPFGVTLRIQARAAREYDGIIAALENPAVIPVGAVERKSYDDHRTLIDRFTALSRRAQRAVGALGLSLLLISFFVVLNTVRIAIYTHREEIGIMKLVGASNWFVRAPFLLEGVLYSAVATVVGSLVLGAALWWGNPALSRFFSDVGLDMGAFYRSYWLPVFGLQFLALAAVNVLGAAVAIRRYLKV
jgi:cell division transport system permease protein